MKYKHLLPLISVGLLVAGCGGDSPGSVNEGALVTQPFASVAVGGDGRLLKISYERDSCETLETVDVTESADEVRLALRLRLDGDGSSGTTCGTGARVDTTAVTLKEALGNRRITDLAKPSPMPTPS